MDKVAGGDLRSLPPKAYASLPWLGAPANYICVIRDIDSDSYRIDSADHPRSYIEALFGEENRTFGIELVALLKTEDLAAAGARLYALYQLRLGSGWLKLDSYQREALRQSLLQIDAYASQYVSAPTKPKVLSTANDSGTPHSALLSQPSQLKRNASWPRRSQAQQPLAERHYGLNALRRARETERLREGPHENRLSLRKRLSQGFDDFVVNHPGLVITIILLLMLLGLLVFGPMPRYGY